MRLEHLLSGRKEMFGASRPSGQVNKEHLLSGSMSRRVKPMQYFFFFFLDDASVSVTKRLVAPAAVERLYNGSYENSPIAQLVRAPH